MFQKHSWQLDWDAMEAVARSVFDRLGVQIKLEEKLENYGRAAAQLVEIAKALTENAKILIMDEPTSSLSGKETSKLFEVIRKLQSQGTSIIYISHRMEEIFQVTDRVTILRDGRVTGTRATADATQAWVTACMLGNEAKHMFVRKPRCPGDPLLEVSHLSSGSLYQDINFKVHRGEVVVLAGLVGSGRTEVARSILGIDGYRSGQILYRGLPLKKDVQVAIRGGIGLVPEDRARQGLILPLKASDNMIMVALRFLSGFAGIRKGKTETAVVQELSSRLFLSPNKPELPTSSFSGGNQQKMVIGKWLATKSDLLILDEPTCGVDIGAKTEIYRLIDSLVAEGKGVLMITSDFAEIELVADRILIMRKGSIVKELTTSKAKQPSRTDDLLKYALGGGQ